MQWNETVTAVGLGDWGGRRTNLALSVITLTWSARRAGPVVSSCWFRITFQREGNDADHRQFASESERAAFVATSMPGWETVSTAPPFPLAGYQAPVAPLVGDELAGVWFVRDYAQLQFEDHIVSLHEWPTVRTGGVDHLFGQVGYRDQLCALIGQKAVAADIFTDDGIVVTFENGELLVTPDTIRASTQTEILEVSPGNRIVVAADLPY